MLPLDARGVGYARNRMSMPASMPEYLCRILDFRQMDFEATFDQMLTLASSNPDRVYKTNFYRKQMKNQWARDDPAFAVTQVAFLVLAALAYGIAFHVRSVGGYLSLIVYCVVVDWFLFGVAVATIGWFIANRYLLQSHTHSVAQKVEWLYAFDIHCNAFFPLFLLLHVLQFFLLPLLLSRSYASMLLANLLYAAAFSAYFYVTHLGYRALPFLTKTEVYLYPIGVVALGFVLSLFAAPLLGKVNATRFTLSFYF
mmetsp:Transcript_31841/g.101300  ORF Transcript_31841/g.101300 Transcript_31841/m.101300 type:complete len:255 (-) Transcript_31841:1891-2655(-)|eukprot:CAMPEP_0118860704 /NCGR_PEP_ID=MMETSP1163-20130328/6471_1 /TAXON_ID=124430 /ORGANISM="Phaeomonas parva, Strain CCMP2877" /LENGTH=254 /DNA_ID=CAMNT_0006794431 /DNA_START=337 /DNA_END=1101 /DNA_ORIENTATION=-